MFPLRFPSPPPPPPGLLAAAAAIAAGGIALHHHSKSHNHPSLSHTLNSLLFAAPSSLMASLSLSDSPPGFVDSRTGSEFPGVIDGGKRRLMGVGVRRKKVFGLKNIDVYAFGVYVDESDVKKYLNEKYRKLAIDVLESTKDFHEGLMEGDVSLTVRLQIVYGRLSIGSVRSAFEESVGSRLRKFGGADTNELLQRFTAQFKDEYKIPKGSVIELSRDNGHTLRTTIDGKEVGSIESKVLCRSVLDLYIGEQPFDERAKEDVRSKLASILESQED
ncbi:Fatty-acid-binding protein 1-like protein [Drosera capensis]